MSFSASCLARLEVLTVSFFFFRFLVGAVQTMMESAIDAIQDHLDVTSGRVREKVHHSRLKETEKGWTRNRELMFKSGDKYERRYFKP